MKWKMWGIIISAVIVIEVPMVIMKVNPILIFAIVIIIVMGGYICWWKLKTRRLIDILDEKCDPIKSIEEIERFKQLSRRVTFQNLCKVNIAGGLLSSGRNGEALNILLHDIDLQVKNSKMFYVVYYIALFCCYLNTDDMERAAFIYDNHIKGLRKSLSINHIKPILCIDTNVLEYHYKRNKSPEAAKIFLEQLNYLYDIHFKKMNKRLKLDFIYNKAILSLELADYAEAAKKFSVVEKNGNGLWIAEMSRTKLREIEARTGSEISDRGQL